MRLTILKILLIYFNRKCILDMLWCYSIIDNLIKTKLTFNRNLKKMQSSLFTLFEL